jgi:hypothetical protein
MSETYSYNDYGIAGWDGGVVVLYYSNTGYEGNWVAIRQPGGEWGGDWRVVEFNKIW